MILMREWLPAWFKRRLQSVTWMYVREALVKNGYTDAQLYDWWLRTYAK